MAQTSYIKRESTGSPHLKIPFIIAMIDSNGSLQTLPFPPQEGAVPDSQRGVELDRIYGIELMVNPQSLISNLSKVVNRTQTMTSFVEDHCGEDLDTITFQGHTAAFVTGGNDIYSLRLNESSPTNTFLKKGTERSNLFSAVGLDSAGAGMGVQDNEIGLTVSRRKTSVSYRQFKRLIELIRINGCTYDSRGMISKRYYIMLSFGNSAYRGFFESIDVTEIATSPYRMQFTINFKSEETLYSYTNQGETLMTLKTTNG